MLCGLGERYTLYNTAECKNSIRTPGPFLVEFRNAAARHEKISAAESSHQADDRRVILAPVPDDHILDRGEPLTAEVKYRPSDDLRYVKHFQQDNSK